MRAENWPQNCLYTLQQRSEVGGRMKAVHENGKGRLDWLPFPRMIPPPSLSPSFFYLSFLFPFRADNMHDTNFAIFLPFVCGLWVCTCLWGKHSWRCFQSLFFRCLTLLLSVLSSLIVSELIRLNRTAKRKPKILKKSDLFCYLLRRSFSFSQICTFLCCRDRICCLNGYCMF